MQKAHTALIHELAALCHQTSAVILSYYDNPDALNVRQKDNATPLTQADLAAHQHLANALPHLISLPIVSEEAALPNICHTDYWLIDPIDGTKEFIRRSGEFCILIARITYHRPTLAFIYAPTTAQYWYAIKDYGAYYCAKGQTRRLVCRAMPQKPTLITHRHQLSQRMQRLLAPIAPQGYERLGLGSALKFCQIAEGKADFYPKLAAKTCEWDSAAGDLLLSEAGGGLYQADGNPLLYGTKSDPTNPPFLATGALDAQQKQLLLETFRVVLNLSH